MSMIKGWVGWSGDDPEKEGIEGTEGTLQRNWRTDQIGERFAAMRNLL